MFHINHRNLNENIEEEVSPERFLEQLNTYHNIVSEYNRITAELNRSTYIFADLIDKIFNEVEKFPKNCVRFLFKDFRLDMSKDDVDLGFIIEEDDSHGNPDYEFEFDILKGWRDPSSSKSKFSKDYSNREVDIFLKNFHEMIIGWFEERFPSLGMLDKYNSPR